MSFSAGTFSVPTSGWCLRSLSTKHLFDRHSPVMHDLRQSFSFKPRALASCSQCYLPDGGKRGSRMGMLPRAGQVANGLPVAGCV